MFYVFAAGFKIHDGRLKLYRIKPDGLVTELLEGTVIRSEFHEDEE